MKRIFAALVLCMSYVLAQPSSVATPLATEAANVASTTVSSIGMHAPVFVGAALGFGSGTGVGTMRGLGLRQIEPMVGVWYPGYGYLRLGYGFFNYSENPEDGERINVEHSDFDVELGIHLMSLLYITGAYSRSMELSDLGDVSWNEWGLGFGSIVTVFHKTMLFAEVTYRWVRNHYDPFLDEEISGSRLQFNIGFAAFVY